MSDAAWRIRYTKNRPDSLIGTRPPSATGQATHKQKEFELEVTTKSEHRPGIVHRWQGRIEIDESGIQHLNSIFLVEAGETNCEGEKATTKEIHLSKSITHEDNAAVIFTKIAKICDEETQAMERNAVEREKREQQDEEQVNTALRRLTELEDEGIHNVPSWGRGTEGGLEPSKASTDMS